MASGLTLRDSTRLLAWYFLAASLLPFGTAGAITHGPFPTRAVCEAAAAWLEQKGRIVIFQTDGEGRCWSDRRP